MDLAFRVFFIDCNQYLTGLRLLRLELINKCNQNTADEI